MLFIVNILKNESGNNFIVKEKNESHKNLRPLTIVRWISVSRSMHNVISITFIVIILSQIDLNCTKSSKEYRMHTYVHTYIHIKP